MPTACKTKQVKNVKLTSRQSFFLCVIAPQFSHAPLRYLIATGPYKQKVTSSSSQWAFQQENLCYNLNKKSCLPPHILFCVEGTNRHLICNGIFKVSVDFLPLPLEWVASPCFFFYSS